MTQKHREFISEVEELLDEASQSLLIIQETLPSPDPDLVNGIFRVMHTIKGMAGLFGYEGFSEISHHLENVLDLIRLGKAEMSLEVTAFLFGCLDILKGMLNEVGADGETGMASVEPMISEIVEFTGKLSAPSAVGGTIPFPGRYRHLLKVLSEYEEHRLRANIKDGKSIFLIDAVYPLEVFDVLLRELTEKIKPVGEVVSTMPVSEGVPAGQIGFQIIVASGAGHQGIKDAAGVEAAVLVDASEGSGAVGADAEGSQESDRSLKSMSSTIRVDISKVDSILDTISDLSLSRQAVSNIWTEMVLEYGNIPLSVDLYRVSQTMQKKISLLQSQVLEVRMVPVRQIFSRIARIVKRHSAEAGIHIRLELYGEDTEMDKYVAEEIVDPLMHLVRNSVDHGIESEKERLEAGKAPQGMIEIRAIQRGNNVIISVRDDGRGIDPEKIRQKAMEKGLISGSVSLDRRELLDLIFKPGFSTAGQISGTSGRGVGLDVVRDRVSFLGGAIEVKGEPGEGTSFVLTLPITLSLIRVLLVRTEREIFAVPLSSMSETFVAEGRDIQEVDGQSVYNLRGEMLPLFHPGDLLKFHHSAQARFFIVVVGLGDRRMGMLFDEFMGQQEIVIKALGSFFEGIKGFAGASEMGRHKVILVLDTETLITEAFRKKGK